MDVFDGHIVFLHSGDRDHVAALLTLKAKWYPNPKQYPNQNNGNNDEQCCVNYFPRPIKRHRTSRENR